VQERHAERLDLLAQLLVVGDHARHIHLQLSAAPAPEQVQQAMVLTRGHQGHAAGVARVCDLPFHAEALRQLAEGRLESRAIVLDRRQVEGRPHEERSALRVGGVLVRGDDVGALLEQKARDGGNDSGPVRTRDEQPGGVVGPVTRVRAEVGHQWLTAAAASSDTSLSS
jgi:hypothetical protein